MNMTYKKVSSRSLQAKSAAKSAEKSAAKSAEKSAANQLFKSLFWIEFASNILFNKILKYENNSHLFGRKCLQH